MSDVQPGSPAPSFDLPAVDPARARLADLTGQWVVLYFYPKDDTTGCTRQAIDFTSHAAAFHKADAVVIGVSKDSLKSHERFKAKHGLDIVLASDAESDVAEQYGVWAEKSMYGRTYMGLERSTFLIGPDGVVRRVWRKVKVPGHVEDVLKALHELKGA